MIGRLFYKLRQFMNGRYGIDSLNKFLVVLFLILSVISIIITRIRFLNFGLFLKITYLSIEFIRIFVLIFFVFRALSRNYTKRTNENNKYLSFSDFFVKKFKFLKERWVNRKVYVYRKCPNCKATLRLPRRKGKHVAVCPKCRHNFNVNVR